MEELHESGVLPVISVVYKGYLSDDDERLIKELGITFPVLAADRSLFVDLGVEAFPTSFLVDPKGNAVRKIVGAMDKNTRQRLAEDAAGLRGY